MNNAFIVFTILMGFTIGVYLFFQIKEYLEK